MSTMGSYILLTNLNMVSFCVAKMWSEVAYKPLNWQENNVKTFQNWCISQSNYTYCFQECISYEKQENPKSKRVKKWRPLPRVPLAKSVGSNVSVLSTSMIFCHSDGDIKCFCTSLFYLPDLCLIWKRQRGFINDC